MGQSGHVFGTISRADVSREILEHTSSSPRQCHGENVIRVFTGTGHDCSSLLCDLGHHQVTSFGQKYVSGSDRCHILGKPKESVYFPSATTR